MQKSFSKRTQQGFTLIELIVVIVILGILAATALPRFLNAAQSARIASAQGLQGAINSAISIVHAQALIQGGSATTVTLDGGTVVNMWGTYPDATQNGIGAAINFTAASGSSTSGYTPTFATSAAASGQATFAIAGAPDAGATVCQVQYTGSSAATVSATNGSIPTTILTTTGC